MVANPFIPQDLVGRRAELNQIRHILASDGDLLLAGVPGSGRRTLLHHAATMVGAKVIEIDCLRATDSNRFLQLLAEGIISRFQLDRELTLIESWTADQPIILERTSRGQARLTWHLPARDEWRLFQSLLALPQALAEQLNCRVVLAFMNFPHIRSWDRSEKWQSYLRQEIQAQTRVSYALISTFAESWVQHSNMQVVVLGPLKNEDLQPWIESSMAAVGLQFEPDGGALQLFFDYVQGHMGDAIALARRIWLDQRAMGTEEKGDSVQGDSVQAKAPDSWSHPASLLSPAAVPLSPIHPHHVYRSALTLVEDLSFTFESLVLLLPPSQVRVLESLALDPTDSPHSREYIQKHRLSRGGGLQGALASLQQKGLVYGPEYHYRITLPWLGFWLKHRLT
ncbi:ATP-binding protein [Leptothermofonsia sichuanensis E412]|uniref:ATP-binding protein n=1 Tax=Leptothermofonsia sichuanensis TaxID=2917832 RepID=UPI001CA6E435|nr:ATP-binding protein [Leptothermofonsia sichuanensis]QZZ19041.1 ATP-binding protein [Leptothermofonsia sichuanensis E412]